MKNMVGVSTIHSFPLRKHYILYGGFKGGSLRVPWIVQRICWYLYRHRVHSKKKSDFL